MKILVVGSGGREHAIVWKLNQSPLLGEVFVAPGNAGTGRIAKNVPIPVEDISQLLEFAENAKVDLTVVGSESPLAMGIVDQFQHAGLSIFGPTKAAARIETSKSFAKALMSDLGIPTGGAEVFDNYSEAIAYLDRIPMPAVIKVDGLAAGKGVTLAETREDAVQALRRALVDYQYGKAGEHILIEEFLRGYEVSVFAFTDGEHVSSLVAACDYKRVGSGDTGPNTGGMGAYSPPEKSKWNESLEILVKDEIIEPVVKGLRNIGCPYQGILYAGLMVTKDGPKVIEFNCRLGDPEAQVVLPKLRTDLLEVMMKVVSENLDKVSLDWDNVSNVGVVLASGGYPGQYHTGFEISGLEDLDDGINVFHAGTRLSVEQPAIVTDGGRVLTIVSSDFSMHQARARAYENVRRVSFKDSFFRSDIGLVV